MSFQRIRSIEIDEGFLGGFQQELSGHLNCVIGSRGSGKTTLLEFLRYALQVPVEDSRSLEGLVKKNLKAGRIRVEVETPLGVFVVERQAKSAPKVFDAQGALIHSPPEGLLKTGAYVYSQSEIEAMASKPMDRLALIDRFAHDDLETVKATLERLDSQLQVSAAQLQSLHGEVGDVEALQHDLESARIKRKSFEGGQVDTNAQLQAATAAASARAEEERVVKSLAKGAKATELALDESRSRALEGLQPRPVGAASPNQDVLKRIQAAQERLRQAIERHMDAAQTEVREFLEECRSVRHALYERHHEQGAAFSELLRQQEVAKAAAAAILEADAAVASLEEKVRDQEARLAQLSRQRHARQSQIARLSEARDRRRATRRRVVEFLNENLVGAGIRIEFQGQGDTQAFEQALSNFYRGTGETGQKRVIAGVVEHLSPSEFARLVAENAAEELATLTHVERAHAEWLIRHLRGKPEHYQIEVLDLPDVPSILFKDGEEWKSSHELSTGQKFSAILPILLLQSDKPLICDEPESHLDQDTLMEKIVDPIKKLAGKRQLIFATHNANIVVLGDAGQTHVVVLESTGTAARVVRAGTVDDAKVEIGALLEGGPEAFRERARRYGGKYESRS